RLHKVKRGDASRSLTSTRPHLDRKGRLAHSATRESHRTSVELDDGFGKAQRESHTAVLSRMRLGGEQRFEFACAEARGGDFDEEGQLAPLKRRTFVPSFDVDKDAELVALRSSPG